MVNSSSWMRFCVCLQIVGVNDLRTHLEILAGRLSVDVFPWLSLCLLLGLLL